MRILRICEVMCPKNAITLTTNQERENPVLAHEAFALPTQATIFDPAAFDWQRREFVIDNCPTQVISYDEEARTLVVDDAHCIRCRQCEIASTGAFQVVQPWEGRVELHASAAWKDASPAPTSGPGRELGRRSLANSCCECTTFSHRCFYLQ